MTPQLQQAIKLLQLSRLELGEMVRQEMLENPALDETAPPDNPNDISLDQPDSASEETVKKESDREEEINVLSIPDNVVEWEAYLDSSQNLPYYVREEQEQPSFEAMVSRPETLQEHLLWQLRMIKLDNVQFQAGETIIGNLDDDGYLRSPLDEVFHGFDEEVRQAGEGVLSLIQQMDPPGVAAVDLAECLRLQINQLGLEDGVINDIIDNHLHDLGKGDYDRLARELDTPRDEIIQACSIIRGLEPKPGRPFGGSEPVYITPDVYLFKMGDEWVISLNDDGMPKLRINSYYRELLQKGSNLPPKDKEFLLEKIRSASWLIKSIDQRQRTIYKVVKSILEKQKGFFERGIRYMNPLVLRDVAEDIGVHESTVSRVTTQKYLHCPHGLFELKYFFNPGIQTLSGEMLASESVRAKIKDIVKAEDPHRPLSDQAISDMLMLEGIDIARRTVAKYRESMNILPSSKRKQSH